MDSDIGFIFLFAGNFAPRNFALCQGQLMSIAQNSALFSILGTTYGGNGVSTFGLPDLRGRTAVGQGQGPGLSQYDLGEITGVENVSILTSNMPAHNHFLQANTGAGTTGTPGNTTYLASAPSTGSGPNAVQLKEFTTTAPNVQMGIQSISTAGSGIPIQIIQPVLCLNYIITLFGIFPTRN
ncbi:tail fiber protein [soil metagenome]|jgi:microcystin-dependent protein